VEQKKQSAIDSLRERAAIEGNVVFLPSSREIGEEPSPPFLEESIPLFFFFERDTRLDQPAFFFSFFFPENGEERYHPSLVREFTTSFP